jgi:hypothetical protein
MAKLLRAKLTFPHLRNGDKLVGRDGSFGWIASAATLRITGIRGLLVKLQHKSKGQNSEHDSKLVSTSATG